MALANVVLNPSKSVTYMPTAMKQLAEVSIENNEATPIIFKWKSTRPGVYKMRPVYGIVRPNEKKTIRLIFKGLGGKQCPTKDHYTCVLAATTSSNVRPELVWKQHRCQTQMADSSMIKRVLKILFVGVNDGPDNTEDKEKMAVLQKRRGLMDDVGGVRGPIVIALYDEGDDSASGDDDDEKEQSAKKTDEGGKAMGASASRSATKSASSTTSTMELVSLLLLLPTVFGHFLPSLLGQPVTSNSGPSEVDEGADEHGHRDKRSYRYWYSHSQYSYSNNLLISSEPPDNYLKKWLTYEHNRYRRMVPATDMHMLYWSDELAASAQRHADTCDFRHSRGRVNVGENIWAAPYSNYSDAISIWFNEVYNSWCQCNHAYKHCCGHYVQVVWAKTNLVGCGFARCRDVQGVWGRGHRAVFVCHYNPQGNTVYVTNNRQLYAMPAFTWTTGSKTQCSDCPEDAPACHQGLCYKPDEPTTTTYNYGTNSQNEYTQEEDRSNYGETNNLRWKHKRI